MAESSSFNPNREILKHTNSYPSASEQRECVLKINISLFSNNYIILISRTFVLAGVVTALTVIDSYVTTLAHVSTD